MIAKKEEGENQGITEANGYEAIILAGGYDSGLQAFPDFQRVLAPIAGKPFLSYIIDYFRMQGVTRFVFALGYLAEQFEKFLKDFYPTLNYSITVEKEPLGTGGGIRLALQKTKREDVLIVNGDTLFKVDINSLFQQHHQTNAACTMALKPGANNNQYETVSLAADGRITGFIEKSDTANKTTNGGIYVLKKSAFFNHSFPSSFSFEKHFLDKQLELGGIYGLVQDGYFIDISLPEDYARAQAELLKPSLDLSQVTKDWTLFIDRDGVINEETVGEYVLHWEQFIFSKGVLQSFKKLSNVFGRLLLVTNQRGVGKGMMTAEALDSIHLEMQREIAVVGGHLDKIYFCTDIHNSSFNRKPNPGMAVQAKSDFPEIDFARSIMVGNKPSDMRFGRAAGMYTVFLATTNPDQAYPHSDIDLRFENLAQFAAAL